MDFKKVNKRLMVSHVFYSEVPNKEFTVLVNDEDEAALVLNVLAYQHLYLFHNSIIPDFCNSVEVLMYDEDHQSWEFYWNEEEGMDWDEIENTYYKNIREERGLKVK